MSTSYSYFGRFSLRSSSRSTPSKTDEQVHSKIETTSESETTVDSSATSIIVEPQAKEVEPQTAVEDEISGKEVTMAAPAEEAKKAEVEVDAAMNVYETAKKVWSWGKTVPVAKFFLGTTEAVASKVLSVKGVSLEDADNGLKPFIHGIDDSLLNPTVSKFVSILGPIYGKMDESVKPVIVDLISKLLSPLKFIKGSPDKDEKVVVVVEERPMR